MNSVIGSWLVRLLLLTQHSTGTGSRERNLGLVVVAEPMATRTPVRSLIGAESDLFALSVAQSLCEELSRLPFLAHRQPAGGAGICQVFRPLLRSPADQRPHMYISGKAHSPTTTTPNTNKPTNTSPHMFPLHRVSLCLMALTLLCLMAISLVDGHRARTCTHTYLVRLFRTCALILKSSRPVLRVQPDRASWLATFPAARGPPAPASSSRRRQRVPTIGNQPPCAPTSRTSAALSGASTPAHRTDVVLCRAVWCA